MKNAFYFEHDYNARNDQKILQLRAEMGWEGYGLYFAILENLCEADGYFKSQALAGLAFGLNLDQARLTEILNFLIKTELLLKDEKGIYSERIKEHLSKRQRLSENGRKGGSKKKAPLKQKESQASDLLQAGEERRGEERRGEKRKEEEISARDSENSLIVSFEKLNETLSGEIFQEQVCMSMGFEKKDFQDFTTKWLARKKLSKDYMYPITKLRNWLITDFEKQKNGNSGKNTTTSGNSGKNTTTSGKEKFRKSATSAN